MRTKKRRPKPRPVKPHQPTKPNVAALRRAVPRLAAIELEGVHDAIERAAAAGVAMSVAPRPHGWTVVFRWQGQRFADWRSSGPIVIAGQLRYVETIGEALDAVLARLQPSERPQCNGDASGDEVRPTLPSDDVIDRQPSTGVKQSKPRREAG